MDIALQFLAKQHPLYLPIIKGYSGILFKSLAKGKLLADISVGKPIIQEEIALRCGVSDVCVYHTIKDYCINRIFGCNIHVT